MLRAVLSAHNKKPAMRGDKIVRSLQILALMISCKFVKKYKLVGNKDDSADHHQNIHYLLQAKVEG